MLTGAAHGNQRFENLRHIGSVGAFELPGQFGGRGRAVAVQRGFDGLHALGHFFRPNGFGGAGGFDGLGLGRLRGFAFTLQQDQFFLALGLIVRAQPVDDASFFLGGALGVQSD